MNSVLDLAVRDVWRLDLPVSRMPILYRTWGDDMVNVLLTMRA
jgi:hypothetical protein